MFEFIGFSADSELLNTLEKGGWVVTALIILSIVALTLTLAKAMQLFRLTWGQQPKLDQLVRNLSEANTSDLQGMLDKLRHPVATPIQPILAAQNRSPVDMDSVQNEVERLSLREMDALQSGLKPLGLIAAIAPLLGLLGTVLGMIEAFQRLQQAGNKVDPSILSGGIWEALLTTAAGLIVAIPVTIILNFLQGRVTKIARSMEDTLSFALTSLKLKQAHTPQKSWDEAA